MANETKRLTKSEEAFVKHLISHPLLNLLMTEEYEKALLSLQYKLEKPKEKKNVTKTSYTSRDVHGNVFLFSMDNKNKNLNMISNEQQDDANEHYLYWSSREKIKLVNFFFELLGYWNEKVDLTQYEVDEETFNIYQNGVEINVDMNSQYIRFAAKKKSSQQQKVNITPSRLREMTKTIMLYLFSELDKQDNRGLTTLHTEIQTIYYQWKTLRNCPAKDVQAKERIQWIG